MAAYPRTIDSGSGEHLTFVRRDGERLIIQARHEPGAGPPMHVHYRQDEGFTVKSGSVMCQTIDGTRKPVRAGESVAFARGVAHKFWNDGTSDAELEGWVEPAENLEYYLTAVYASMREHGGSRPGLFDIAYLSRRYRSEFGNLMVPAPVRAVVFPIACLLGAVLGKFAKFRDAPAPY
jgi:mannose-6-phosphate isomerase-like protein (cupin superfamily)